MRRLALASALGLLLAGGLLANGGAEARAANELKVSVVGDVSNAAYPALEAQLSVVDAATGRPVTELTAEGVTVNDDAGRAPVAGLAATTSSDVPGAYVLLIDTSAGMGPHLEQALPIIRQFVSSLGRNDVLRLVKFNSGIDEGSTNWLTKDDPNLEAQLQTLQASDQAADVTPALVRAAEIASAPPGGIGRHGVVAFLGVDGSRPTEGLAVDAIAAKLPTATFTFGFGTPPANEETFTRFLDDVGKYTGGAYWPVGSPKYPADPVKLLLGIMQRTWTVHFTADALPDSGQHHVTFTVRDQVQRSGEETAAYSSGRLEQVSPLAFKGVREGEEVDSDRDIQAVAAGKQWPNQRIELFVDCDPGRCRPDSATDKAALDYKIAVGPLEQGSHRLTAKLTVSDGQREFSDVAVLNFERTGTTFNLGWVVLIGGVALLAIFITVMAARRRGGEDG